MKKETIDQLYKAFEQYALEVNGIECWSARELQELLGYSKWENFSNVIDKAKDACKNVGQSVVDHFPDVRKTIPMPRCYGIAHGILRTILLTLANWYH
jgi:DNA-damage-inducible protein D